MRRADISTVEELLSEYHDAERNRIIERSSNFAADTQELDDDVLIIANNLGVVWKGCDCRDVYLPHDYEEDAR